MTGISHFCPATDSLRDFYRFSGLERHNTIVFTTTRETPSAAITMRVRHNEFRYSGSFEARNGARGPIFSSSSRSFFITKHFSRAPETTEHSYISRATLLFRRDRLFAIDKKKKKSIDRHPESYRIGLSRKKKKKKRKNLAHTINIIRSVTSNDKKKKKKMLTFIYYQQLWQMAVTGSFKHGFMFLYILR